MAAMAAMTRLRALLRPKPMEEECQHEIYSLDELQGWCYCHSCKDYFPFDEVVYTPDSDTPMTSYSQEYSTVRNFAKYLRRLRRENPNLPEIEPLQQAYIRFTEAYRKCRFISGGKVIGRTRNLFGNKYTLYRLARLLSETDRRYLSYAKYVQRELPAHLSKLDNHWTELNANLCGSWQSQHAQFRPLFRQCR